MSQACCNHSHITTQFTEHPGGGKSQYWKCDTCETQFYPEQVDQTARNRRDHFAGEAMKGILCSMNRMMQFDGPGLARDSYAIADLMLAERNKP